LTGAFGIGAYLRSEVIFSKVIQAIQDLLSHRIDGIRNGNTRTLITEIATPFIPCPGRIKGSVMGQDLKGDHLKLMEEVHQHMEDFIIEPFPEADAEIGEGPLRGDMLHRDASVSPVRSASVFIAEDFEELTHMRIPIDVSEEIE
jgi:hypothetical protein